MKTKEKAKMGRFAVDVEIINNRDSGAAEGGYIEADEVRRKIISGVVDPGATLLVLPQALVKELGLPLKGKKYKVRYADGRRGTRYMADDIRLKIMGREGIFTAIIEPKRDTALIGAIVLEALDFLVDCAKTRLVPRDPDFIFSEIE